MLEAIIKRARGIVLGFVVFILSAVFVLQFGGPQAQGCNPGGDAASEAARVYGRRIPQSDFNAAYVLAGGDRYPSRVAQQNRLKELVLYGLVERALLAREARSVGFDVTEDDVMQQLVEDGTLHLSLASSAPAYLPSGRLRFDFTDSDGNFSHQNVRNFIQYRLGRSIRDFARSQIDEVLAQRMRELITGGVTVSDAEVWNEFVRDQEKVTLSYVRFSPVYYRDRLQVDEAALAQWMQDNDGRLQEEYESQKHRYTGLEKQVRARHILIKADHDAADEDKQQARDKAAQLLKRARGGEDFAQLAREHSEDEGSARKGGDLGYNPRGRMVEAFDEVQFSLAPGEISDLVESRYGFHIVRVEGVREGDVPVEEVRQELAERMFRDERSQQLAKEAAEQALATLRGDEGLEALSAQLPTGDQEEDALAPALRETRAFGRTDTPIHGPFDATPLVQGAFALSAEQPLPEAPVQLGEDFVVYRLVDRTHASRETFDAETRQRFYERLLAARQQEALQAHVQRLLQAASSDGAVAVNEALLRYDEAT